MISTPDALKRSVKGQAIIKEIRTHSFSGKVYLVGGALRELVLKKHPKDYDFALTDERDVRRFEEIFGSSAFLLGKKPIGTHRIVTKDLVIDIALLSENIGNDLLRRDFTMNAMAFDIMDDRILDTTGGMEDIGRRLIRYTCKETIPNDPLRMLKAVRHSATLNNFVLHSDLLSAILELSSLITGVAPERIKQEMDQIICSPGAFKGITILEKTGLLFEVFPELLALRTMDREKGFTLETFGHSVNGFKYLRRYVWRYGLEEKMVRNVGYALLFHDLGKAYTFSRDEQKGLVHFYYHERFSMELAGKIMERLRFSTQEIKTILSIIESHMRAFLITTSGASEKAVRRLVYKMEDLTPALILHTLCDMYGSSGGKENPSTRQVKHTCRLMMAAYSEWKKEPLPRLISGYDLLGLGFKEGPFIGKVLDTVREKQIAGDITDRDTALQHARELMEGSV